MSVIFLDVSFISRFNNLSQTKIHRNRISDVCNAQSAPEQSQ